MSARARTVFDLDDTVAEIGAHHGLTLSIVGKRPQNTPYVRLNGPNDEYLGSLDEETMRALRDSLTRALGGSQ